MALAYDSPSSADEGAQGEELLRMLKQEENGALGYRQSELEQQQIDALKAYYGELYGDEEEGRSKTVTREVLETIEWTRPDLMRVFASGGQIVHLEESSEEDSKYAKDAGDYLSWIFFSDNPGFENLDDFSFDGLLHRRGFIACYWRDAEYRAPQQLTGLNIMQVQELLADPQVQIVGHEMSDDSEVGGINLTVRRVKSAARAEIVTVAPEDMRLNGRAIDIDEARYVGRVQRLLRGEIARLFPDKADEINAYSGTAVSGPSNTRRGSDVRMERFRDQNDDWQGAGNNAAQELELLEEYLRVDLNGDGYPETIRSYRLGDLLLDFEEVEENPFGSWSPIRIPHKFYGLGMHDLVADLQRRSTVLTRAGLDAVYQSVVNREAFDKNKVDLNSLLATYSGAKVEVDGPPGDSIVPLTGGLATAQTAWEALNQMSVTLENRTGATRQTQGTDPDALLKGPHSGRAIDLLQTAGAARKEMMARNMGAGLGRFFSKLYRLVCRNQNQPRAAKVGGKWAQFDPRTWNSDLRVHIHTGLGTGNREQTMIGIQAVMQVQQEIIDRLGPANPLVKPSHIHRSFEEMCRALGWRGADPFMAEPPEDWAPEPQPSPEMAKIQADSQAKQAQMQMDAQAEQQRAQLEVRRTEAQLQQERAKAELTLQLQRDKAAAELDLARAKARSELDLAREKMQLEMQLAFERMEMEAELEDRRIASQERIGKAKAGAADTDTISDNRPGGDLDK